MATTLARTDFRPVILVRGFDPLAESQKTTYYGFNDGTVYPHKQGDDFIYEGMLLKFLKTGFKVPRRDITTGEEVDQPDALTYYKDATNAVCYDIWRGKPSDDRPDASSIALLAQLLRRQPSDQETAWMVGPMKLAPDVATRFRDCVPSVWVYRYYDFRFRDVAFYAQQLARLISMVETVTGTQGGVNLICHSMGGLIARYLIQRIYGNQSTAHAHINKWVTLGTPHRGIEFQVFKDLNLWELEVFNRERLEDAAEFFGKPLEDISPYFDPDRLLCVIGTNWRAYAIEPSIALNQLASWLKGQDQNHSDGLVKQECAALKDAHRAYVYKCHGGDDSLVTAREAFELATRFFFGDIRVRVRALSASIHPKREAGHESLGSLIGAAAAHLLGARREYYLGFSVKPRQLDFYLNRQDADSENCFGPFDKTEFAESDFRNDEFDPARTGVVYEGFLNSALIPKGADNLVFRFDTYVGERDPNLFGHSDTAIVAQQSYFQAFLPTPGNPVPDGAPCWLRFYPNGLAGPPIDCTWLKDAQEFDLDLPYDGVPNGSPGRGLSSDFKIHLRISIAPAA